MTGADARTVVEGYDAWNRRDLDTALEVMFDQRFSHLFTMREGRVVRFEAFADRDAAPAAAALPSPGTNPPG